MHTCRTFNNKVFRTVGRPVLGFALLALVGAAPQAEAQFTVNGGGRSTIEGSVLIDGVTQPAARIRVDVKALTGGSIATTFTDSTGRFQAPAQGTRSGIVAVQEDCYRTGGQHVEVRHAGSPG